MLLSRVAVLALLVASACVVAADQDIDNNEVLPESDIPSKLSKLSKLGRWPGVEWPSAAGAAVAAMDPDGLSFYPERGDPEVTVLDQADKDAEVVPVTTTTPGASPPAATETTASPASPASSTEAPASSTRTPSSTPPPKRPGGFLSGFLSDIIQIPITVLQSVGSLLRATFSGRTGGQGANHTRGA